MEKKYGIKFLSSRRDQAYTYKAYEELQPKDIVVIEALDNFSLGEVVEEIEGEIDYKGPLKQVVAKVDFKLYNERKEQEEIESMFFKEEE